MANLSERQKRVIFKRYSRGFKKCNSCGKIKPIDQFNKTWGNSRTLIPLRHNCISCGSLYYKKYYSDKCYRNKLRITNKKE